MWLLALQRVHEGSYKRGSKYIFNLLTNTANMNQNSCVPILNYDDSYKMKKKEVSGTAKLWTIIVESIIAIL